jgi:uncharacterized protein (TIGR02246 family)
VDAWNRHDMDAFVADTTPDADWINVVGMHWKGRDTVRRAHAVMHAGLFARSRMLPPEQSEMRQIAPNVVIETQVGRLEGVGLRPDGKPYPDDGNLMTMVFVKSGNGWRIAHAHNGHIDKQAAPYDPGRTPVPGLARVRTKRPTCIAHEPASFDARIIASA